MFIFISVRLAKAWHLALQSKVIGRGFDRELVANGRSFLISALSVFGIALLSAAEAPQRIYSDIRSEKTFRLAGNTRPGLAMAEDRGEVDYVQALPRMTLHFSMSEQQQEDLEQLLRQQQAHGSAQFHKFLTPEEYGARFGVSSPDIAKVTAWLSEEGFSNIQVARSKTFVTFAGIAGQVQTAFHTSLHRYLLNGQMHYANATDPLMPMAMEGMVESIGGLHDFRRKPLGIRRQRPQFTSTATGNHFLAPNDFETIYNVQPLYQSGFDGTGIKIAVVGQSDILLSDVRAFRTAAGLPQNDPTITVVGADPGLLSSSGDETESDLDVEWAGAIAKNASVIFVTETDVLSSIAYTIDNNLAPVLSISYGACEADTGSSEFTSERTQFQQANAQGMTVVVSAGDSGAADCDTGSPATHGLAVDVPASIPYVTAIGGTTLSEGTGTYWNTANNGYGGSAIAYIPEVVWNDSSSINGLEAGGGGKSSFTITNTKPAWQTGTGVPADGVRDVPDIAFAASPAHDGYLICSNGDCVNGFRNADSTLDEIGGTSCGAPSFAGIVALMVQMLGKQGNINPQLYSLANSSKDIFHDVTSGSNAVACRLSSKCTTGTIGYPATAKYDLASGWGSVNAYHLLNEWTSDAGAPVGATAGPLGFVPMTPCRVLDTRNATGTFGGPELAAGATREFQISSSSCGVPTTAAAYALNLTVVPDNGLSYLSIWPAGQAKPLVSTLNSDGRVKANAAIVAAGTSGSVNVYASDSTHLIMDISGYFPASGGSSGLEYFPLTPCRLADTRLANGSFGSPSLTGGQNRTLAVRTSSCNVPAAATAYALNFTAVPHGGLGFFSAWPTGQSRPLSSVLNASRANVAANAAIVEAGTNGSINTYASDNTDIIIDINGYFAPAATGGLSLYTLTPCRIIDTRNPAGSPPVGGTGAVDVMGSGCGVPSVGQAYVLNATVVPAGWLGYLALWPNAEGMPLVSTLNADSSVTSNLAIVGTSNGSINTFASGPTYLILDIAGYFAP